MGRRFLASSSYAGVLADNLEQMAATARWLIDLPRGAVFVAEARDGTLTAMMGIVLFPHHISGALTAIELFWWSETPGAGIRILRRAEAWARGEGATLMQMVQPLEAAPVRAIYQRFGYLELEVNWQKAL
jgi:hypothetical protein